MSCKVGAIIAAGGISQRMAGVDKIFAPIGRIPVIAKTCLAFQVNENITDIVVSVREDRVQEVKCLLEAFGITKARNVVSGGKTRAESVSNALKVLPDCDYVAIHDGARPLVSQKLINDCAQSAFEYGSAVPVIPSTDTLKSISNHMVSGTVDREKVFRVQTPQIFKRDIYESAVYKYSDMNFTDDCALLEKAGVKVHTCNGAAENIKITVPSDIDYAEFLMRGKNLMLRIGHGYDVHRLQEGRKLIIGGVDIPYEKGLLGHSDADVALHALMDSLLGAAALGDIGKLFPDTDPGYSGANSMKLLERTVETLSLNGYRIINVDITIVAERPKLSPYIEQMKYNISSACSIPVSSVSVKATTEEKLGFTGAGEGISATAVSLISE